MKKGNLQARIKVGNRIEILANHEEKIVLIVLLSSKLEDEQLGACGEIFDIDRNEIIYRCCRNSY